MKKVRMILIVCIVMLLISIIGLSIYSINKNKQAEDEYVMEKPIEEALEGKLYPNNFTEFYFAYKGRISTNDIYTKLYEIVEVGIPKLNLDVKNLDSDEKINNYYNDEDYIEDTICIGNKDYFKKLVKILRDNNVSKLEYTISEIKESTTKVYRDRTEFYMDIDYKDSNTITLKVVVYNAKKSDGFISIIPIIEE